MLCLYIVFIQTDIWLIYKWNDFWINPLLSGMILHPMPFWQPDPSSRGGEMGTNQEKLKILKWYICWACMNSCHPMTFMWFLKNETGVWTVNHQTVAHTSILNTLWNFFFPRDPNTLSRENRMPSRHRSWNSDAVGITYCCSDVAE